MFTCVYMCLHIYMSDDLELKSHLSEIPIPIKTQVGR